MEFYKLFLHKNLIILIFYIQYKIHNIKFDKMEDLLLIKKPLNDECLTRLQFAQKWITITHSAEMYENLRNTIIGKHRDISNIMKLANPTPFETSPYIAYQYLSSFIKTD